MNFESASVEDLLCIAEAASNKEIKREVHLYIFKRVYEDKISFKNENEKVRFNKLSEQIFDAKDLAYFDFIVSMRKNNDVLLRKRISTSSYGNVKIRKTNNTNNSNCSASENLNQNINICNDNNETLMTPVNNDEIIETNNSSENSYQGNQSMDDSIDEREDEREITMTELVNNEEIIEKFNSENEISMNNDYNLTNDSISRKFIENIDNNMISIDQVISEIKSEDEIGCEIVQPPDSETNTIYDLNDFEIINQAFRGRIISYSIKNRNDCQTSIKQFLNDIKMIILNLIEEAVKIHTAIIVNFILFGMYIQPLKKEENSIEIKPFNTINYKITDSSNLSVIFDNIIDILTEKTEDFHEYGSGSGWSLMKIINLQLNINKYNPLRASSYIPLPITVLKKNAIINVKNTSDNQCFKWSMLSGLHISCAISHRENITSYIKKCQCGKKFNFDKIKFPFDFKQIELFEKINKISLNVFGLNENNEIIGPLHHTQKRCKNHFNLLYFGNEDGNYHYCYIKDMSRLVSHQLSKHESKKYICDGCLLFFYRKKVLEKHQSEHCSKVKAILPEPEFVIKFDQFNASMKVCIIN